MKLLANVINSNFFIEPCCYTVLADILSITARHKQGAVKECFAAHVIMLWTNIIINAVNKKILTRICYFKGFKLHSYSPY